MSRAKRRVESKSLDPQVNILKSKFVKDISYQVTMKRVPFLLLFPILSLLNLAAQAAGTESVPMADRLREDGKIWVVVLVVAVVFAGISINMLRIDFKLKKIEKELNIK
jgi:hypothetical protein